MTATAYGPRINTSLAPANVTRIAKQVAPELRWSSEKGARGILTRVWNAPQDGTDRTELHLLNEARRLINARTDLTASVVSLRSRKGRPVFRLLVTSEAQETAEQQERADARAAEVTDAAPVRRTLGQMQPAERDAVIRTAVAQLQRELTAAAPAIARVLEEPLPGEVQALGDALEAAAAADPLRQAAVAEAETVPSPGAAARERGQYAIGHDGELVELHVTGRTAVRAAESMRARGFGATVYGPCGHPLREYLSRDSVRELEACRRCVQVRQAADVLRAGGRLTGGLRAANVETEARHLLAAEDAYDGGQTAQAAAELRDPGTPAGAALDAAVRSTQAVSAAHAAEDALVDALTFRNIRSGAYAVLQGEQVIGRILRTTPARARLTARWAAYLPGGGQVTAGAFSRRDAGRALVKARTTYGTSPAAERVAVTEAATLPCWHVETAHGALYGVAAQNLRDALQMTQDRLTEERSADLPKRGQRVGTWRTAYGTVLCYRGSA